MCFGGTYKVGKGQLLQILTQSLVGFEVTHRYKAFACHAKVYRSGVDSIGSPCAAKIEIEIFLVEKAIVGVKPAGIACFIDEQVCAKASVQKRQSLQPVHHI